MIAFSCKRRARRRRDAHEWHEGRGRVHHRYGDLALKRSPSLEAVPAGTKSLDQQAPVLLRSSTVTAGSCAKYSLEPSGTGTGRLAPLALICALVRARPAGQ